MIDKVKSPLARLRRIAEIIEAVDHRCLAADGPVTPTLAEMTPTEIRRIYELACGFTVRGNRRKRLGAAGANLPEAEAIIVSAVAARLGEPRS